MFVYTIYLYIKYSTKIDTKYPNSFGKTTKSQLFPTQNHRGSGNPLATLDFPTFQRQDVSEICLEKMFSRKPDNEWHDFLLRPAVSSRAFILTTIIIHYLRINILYMLYIVILRKIVYNPIDARSGKRSSHPGFPNEKNMSREVTLAHQFSRPFLIKNIRIVCSILFFPATSPSFFPATSLTHIPTYRGVYFANRHIMCAVYADSSSSVSHIPAFLVCLYSQPPRCSNS